MIYNPPASGFVVKTDVGQFLVGRRPHAHNPSVSPVKGLGARHFLSIKKKNGDYGIANRLINVQASQ